MDPESQRNDSQQDSSIISYLTNTGNDGASTTKPQCASSTTLRFSELYTKSVDDQQRAR